MGRLEDILTMSWEENKKTWEVFVKRKRFRAKLFVGLHWNGE